MRVGVGHKKYIKTACCARFLLSLRWHLQDIALSRPYLVSPFFRLYLITCVERKAYVNWSKTSVVWRTTSHSA